MTPKQEEPEFVRSDVPLRYLQIDVGLLPPQLTDVARRYVANFMEVADSGIAPLFVGRAGCFKSTTAAMILKSIAVRHRVSSVWINSPSELAKLERDRYSPHTSEQISRWKTASLLVFDDIAALAPHGWELKVFQEVITTRFDALRPTLVTANLTVDKERKAFTEFFGVCVARRLLEMSEGYRVVIR